ncbi:MotA/TolQ/ExbB proton channel family protein, partial [Vibrio metoecus]|uniref:MotA/TolQ/ExbB proton channel family protein n=1 Tax=Vibrio metoecus TaxID=1481663 RepID=UPI00215C2B23
MYFLGYVVYVLVVIAYFKFPVISGFLEDGLRLAPEIVSGMLLCLFFPPLYFLYHIISKSKDDKAKRLLEMNSKVAGGISVSLGLIGTFIGLTQMVAEIAKSMSGKGELAERMANMLSSISSALSSMSYAFLTSIIGVAVSIIITLALSFFVYYYDRDKKKEHTKDKQMVCTCVDTCVGNTTGLIY